MPKRNWFLFAALAGLAGFICMLVVVSVAIGFVDPNRATNRDPGGERRQSVEQSLSGLLPAEAESAGDPGLVAAAEKLSAEKYIAWVWLMEPDGTISYVHGGPAHAGDSVRDLSAYEEDLMLAVEPALRSPDTEMELRLAAALRREGEHNDIFGHTVRSIPGPDGKAAAYIGITYEAVDTTPGVADIVFVILGAIGFLFYWFGLPLWVVFDARAGGPGRSAILWGLFVLVANAAGLLAYLLVKHRSG